MYIQHSKHSHKFDLVVGITTSKQSRTETDLLQCCHSKKIENPRLGNKKPKKTQGQISIRFRNISGKNLTFPEKSKLFLKKCLFIRQNFLITFYFFKKNP